MAADSDCRMLIIPQPTEFTKKTKQKQWESWACRPMGSLSNAVVLWCLIRRIDGYKAILTWWMTIERFRVAYEIKMKTSYCLSYTPFFPACLPIAEVGVHSPFELKRRRGFYQTSGET